LWADNPTWQIFYWYWGWAKYQYWEVEKPTFDTAKKAAVAALDACPIEVIQKFIN
jgi:hypothetical protein